MLQSTTGVTKNSLNKVVTTYLAAVTKKPLYFDGHVYLPKSLHVSPLIFRHYTCPPQCGACCPRFELVYLPIDPRPPDRHIAEVEVEVDGKTRLLYVDTQSDNTDHFCRNLIKETGRCGIHGFQPFSCDFELLRVLQFADHHLLVQKLFGRAWNMLNVLGSRGTSCEMIPQDDGQKQDLVRRLCRLQDWADYFELDTYLPDVIEWCESGPHAEKLILFP